MPIRLNRNINFLLISCLLALSLTGCGTLPPDPSKGLPVISTGTGYPPVTITNFDAAGNLAEYTYRQIPTRVVVTHPGATELLLELGLEDRILATVAPYGPPLERLREKYAKTKILQAQYAPSREEILDLEPDMVIGWPHHFSENVFGDIQSWHTRGVATFIVPSTLRQTKPLLENNVYAYIADIGKIFGIPDQANQYIQDCRQRVARVEAAVRNIPQKKTVLVLQDHLDGKFSLYDSSYLVSSLIASAGGQHIGDTLTAIVGAEEVLSHDPDFILFVSVNRKDAAKDLTDQEAITHLKGIRELQSMRAIEQGNIINVPFFSVNNGGVRIIDVVEKIAKTLYPECFD